MILKPRLFRKPNLGHPFAKGLIGYWLMNEGSGEVHDLSGNGKIGTFNGAFSWIGGKFGSGLSFDGSGGSEITFGNFTLPTVSVVWWSRNNGQDASHERQISFGSSAFETDCANTDAVRLFFGEGWQETGVDLSQGVWYQQAVTYDGTTVKYYNNGKLEYSNAGSVTISADEFIIAGKGNENFNGDFDSVALFNYALADSQIAQLYQEPFAIFEREPIELWVGSVGVGAPPVGNAGIMTPNTGLWGPTF